MTNFSSPVEVGARLTSNFSRARKLFGVVRAHAGSDWAPKKSGDKTSPVYAVADGIVSSRGVGVLSGHSGLIIVLDHGIIGGDRTLTNYGHLTKTFVSKGDRVKAGQLIAFQGDSGNVTGVHLHLGVRFNGKFHDPKVWLKTKGIVPGKTAPRSQSVAPVASKPPVVSKPSTTPPKTSAKFSQRTKNIQVALENMGYDILTDGINGSKTIETIKEYQRSQQAPYKLFVDGVWGPKVIAHYVWVKKLQTATNKWKGTEVKVDGHYGANTVSRIRTIQKANEGRSYKGKVDGVPGRVFCKMIGIVTHP